ncbi:MAG TPA: CBS domain-containing protein, partial [Ktedonobacteraceae bacterium]|nr:CBS domain-containing protein [Ktedonobacteraceae bacterium]
MLYLSQLLGAPVEDPQGERIGKIIDVVETRTISPPSESTSSTSTTSTVASPPILVIEGNSEHIWYVPVQDVEWHENVLRLLVPTQQLSTRPLKPSEGEQQSVSISLAQEVLDKQVIDIVRKKAVRVNDVCLSDDWHILGIDSSTLGLVRRLAPNWLLGTHRGSVNRSQRPPTNLILWENIELINSHQPDLFEAAESDQQVTESHADITEEVSPNKPKRIQSGQLAELHPADIADIVHQLTPAQGARILEGLDIETAADTLEEIETERQGHILENINAGRAADILDAMGPDEAADLLARLPEEYADQLLHLMQPEESEDVQELLTYEEDSAGGIMTTDYIVANATKSVAEALDAVRASIRQDVRPTYVYCVTDDMQDETKILGVVSLWDLLVAPPSQLLQEIMDTDLITVRPDTEPRTVAETMAKYNLLAVPVVNAEGMLEGVVTV